MRPEELSRQLRLGSGGFLKRRREVVGLSLAAAGSLGIVTLYQTGLIPHVPEPPLPFLDADAVDAAPEAYARLSMPDGILGIGNHTVTMALAAAGGQDRATEHPWLPLALAAKVAFDTFVAYATTLEQWEKHRAFCLWCLLSAGASVATVPLVLPESWAALREVFRRVSR